MTRGLSGASLQACRGAAPHPSGRPRLPRRCRLLKADFSRARQRDGVLSILGTVVVLAGPLVALPTLAPAWWFRHRAALVLATRLAFLLGRNEADPLALYQVFQVSRMAARETQQTHLLFFQPLQTHK